MGDGTGDYTETEVLWLLSLTAEEAQHVDADTSLRWWDVQNAHRTLGLTSRRTRLVLSGWSHREVARIEGLHHTTVMRQMCRTAERIAIFLNGDCTKSL